jgi:hypothetical protein
MDPKERKIVASLVERVRSLTFGEQDVMLLLISLRAHASGDAPLVVELSDFIAHRAKDRGLLLESMKELEQALQPGAPAREFFDAPVSVRTLHGQLTTLFARLRLPALTLEATECLAVVSSTVLHEVQFHEPGMPSPRLRYLQFGFNAHLVGLFGVVPLPASSVTFPVMAVKNRFFESPFEGHPETYWFPDRGFIVTSAVRDGEIGLYQEPVA